MFIFALNMTKKEKILQYYNLWLNDQISVKEISKRTFTNKDYVSHVMNKLSLQNNYRNRISADLKTYELGQIFESRLTPEHKLPTGIIGITYDRPMTEIKPIKVNNLPDGRTELIYSSKMNVEC